MEGRDEEIMGDGSNEKEKGGEGKDEEKEGKGKRQGPKWREERDEEIMGDGSNEKEIADSSLSDLHRKKRFTSFPSPAGMSLTKLPLGRNNSVMTSLFPPRESLVVTSRLGTGNSRTFFLRCS
jgi:hypothetical protein